MSFLLNASPSVFLLIVLGGLTVLLVAWLWIASFFTPNTFEPVNAMQDTNAPPKPDTATILPTSSAAYRVNKQHVNGAFAAATPTTAVSLTVPAKRTETVESFNTERPQEVRQESSVLPEQAQAISITLPDLAALATSEPTSMVVASLNSTALQLRPWQLYTPSSLRRRPPLGRQTIRLLHLG